MIDDINQLPSLSIFKTIAGFPARIFIKLDTGYHRAGIPPASEPLQAILSKLAALEKEGLADLLGFYSHSGHSYHEHSNIAIMSLLTDEITLAEPALAAAKSLFPSKRLTLSVGATPTSTSIQNILSPSSVPEKAAAQKLQASFTTLAEYGVLEIHAGVYPLLDEQQFATHARPAKTGSDASTPLLSRKDLALTILTEVCSVYSHRTHPESLINAGSLALGREPAPSYRGWGVVTNWNMSTTDSSDGPLEPSGLIVERISQEHGILARENRESGGTLPLKTGQRLRVFPNHACIAGAGYGWYFVVDSSMGRRDEIVDVWVRWRGW
jgi:D-serine ammonia-lyase